MVLAFGDSFPEFTAPTATFPRFNFGTAAGRYIVLAFLPIDPAALTAVSGALGAHRGLFDDLRASFFGVLRNLDQISRARDMIPGIRWFLDGEGTVSRQCQAFDGTIEQPQWIVLDPALRVLFTAPLEAGPQVLQRVATLPPLEDYAGTQISAPILVVPRVFEPEFCQRLIAYYEATGGQPSGVMKERDGRTVRVADLKQKRRSDTEIDDQKLIDAARARIGRRLTPPILKAFQFNATRIERHIVACYDSETGGWFGPHRDNTTRGTAHRRFAVTINLNAGEYDGGDLKFPEFGSRTHRAPTGGAVVFSCSLLHEATPVTRGKRYAYLPFLYDEEGAKVREANAGFLEPELQGYRNQAVSLPTAR